MNINDLTIGQLKEIQSFLNSKESEKNIYPVGRNVIVRTVTMIYTGRLELVTDTDFVLTSCAWIPETDRYSDFVEKGSVNECEPYPDEIKVFINRGALIDMCELIGSLPRSKK